MKFLIKIISEVLIFLNVNKMKNPQGPQTGSHRVVRGGSWGNYARNLRSAARSYDSPGGRYFSVGFRLLRMPNPLPSNTVTLGEKDENKSI